MVENSLLFAQDALGAAERFGIELLSEITSGRHLVLGSPGSGKTAALRNLVLHLESEVAVEDILVLTPTRRAAANLRDLIALASKKPAAAARAQSITGFAFAQIQASSPGIRLLSGAMQQKILSELIAQSPNSPWGFDLQTIGLQGFVQEIRDLLAVCIEHQLAGEDLIRLAQKYEHRGLEIAGELLPSYQKALELQGLVDPSQLLIEAAKLSHTTTKWVLVDDAQDLSRAGLSLVSKLAEVANLVLFGDPDSSVLGFRSSVQEGFVREFKSAHKHYLEPKSGFSNSLSKLASKLPPQLAGLQRPRPTESGQQISCGLFDNQIAEADWLASEIRQRRMRDELSWNDFAVVARTRTQLD